MRFHQFASLAAGAALCAATASAQDRADRFVQRDLNRDGVLSQSEYTGTGGHPGNFRALDTNNDGVLSRGEFVNRGGQTDETVAPPVAGVLDSAGGPEFARMDRNNDRRVSRAEWDGDMAVFRRIDVNDDRLITASEYVAYASTAQSAVGPEFVRMDRNRDNLVTRAEWDGDAAIFRRMDVNDDRIVTSAEYVAYHRAVNEGQLVKDPAGVLVKDQRQFQVLDYDNDGRLSRREWNGDRREFDAMDVNNDGVVTYGEYVAPIGNFSRPGVLVKDAREFRVLDYDNDGRLTRREWNRDRREFDLMDVNNDGLVTYNEYVAPVENDLRALRFRELDRNRDGRLTRGESGLDRSTFRMLDRNNDGRVTREEFRDTRQLENSFSRLDRDRDGRLERREWQGTVDSFRWFDRNRDGRVTRDEFLS